VSTRGAASVGAGLAPARQARPIRPGERIHVVGIGGAGASAAALLAAWAGADVDGCDSGGPGSYTPALDAVGIHIFAAHDAGHVEDGRPNRLAVTKALTAIDPDHAELVAARAAGVPLESWQQVVADAAFGRRLVGVAGTHGKSTTSGWLVHVLAEAGADPGAFVGALLPASLTGIGVAATARRGGGAPFVVEADEYAGNFDAYHPEVIILTSAEWDHPDVFEDRAAVLDAFEMWIRAAALGVTAAGPVPVLVANVADDGVAELCDRLADWPGRLVATRLVADGHAGVDDGAGRRFRTLLGPAVPLEGHITALERDSTVLSIVGFSGTLAPLTAALQTAGRHNAANALGVAGAAEALGIEPAAIIAGLSSFAGVGRRLERKGEARGVVVYDDYGHHPTAIRETLLAVRQREPGRRVWAVYEPLTFHRTAALLHEFAAVLATADAVAVADIWAGRDPDTTVASAVDLAAAVARHRPMIPVAAPGSVEATARWLAREVREGDVVLVMGGGRSYRIGELLLEHLVARESA
jgi:UDP-N-acetylmuramate--alanine ligase